MRSTSLLASLEINRSAMPLIIWSHREFERGQPSVRRLESPEFDMTDLNKDEKVVVARTSFNVANTIAAVALLALVFGLLKYLGVSPI